jgi:predicted enzyme related to lactoylglutathione lyase
MIVKMILPRFYVEDLDQAVAFYEKLFNTHSQNRFAMPEAGLEIARVENILLICGSAEALQPFKDTSATFLVDSLGEFEEYLRINGVEILRGPQAVPTGRNMHVKHPDGTIVEYVEHGT